MDHSQSIPEAAPWPARHSHSLEDEDHARAREAYGPNYARLVALKNRYDPTNLFHLNQNVEPTP